MLWCTSRIVVFPLYDNWHVVMIVALSRKNRTHQAHMAKRLTASDRFLGSILGLALVIYLPVYFVSKIIDISGWEIPALVIVSLIALPAFLKIRKKKARIRYLKKKYKDDALVDRILSRGFWQGQTEEQLVDAIGQPEAVDHKLLKTRRREIWKYHTLGKNRFALRITIDDGLVST